MKKEECKVEVPKPKEMFSLSENEIDKKKNIVEDNEDLFKSFSSN
jgi:hypothetical protein